MDPFMTSLSENRCSADCPRWYVRNEGYSRNLPAPDEDSRPPARVPSSISPTGVISAITGLNAEASSSMTMRYDPS